MGGNTIQYNEQQEQGVTFFVTLFYSPSHLFEKSALNTAFFS